MGMDGDIMISHNPNAFNHGGYFNSFGCRFQNQQGRTARRSPCRTGSKTTSAEEPQRKPSRPCLVVRQDDSSSDENEHALLSPTRQKKKVVFADQRGLSLTQIRVVEPPTPQPASPAPMSKPALQLPRAAPANPWKITFSQPASNYLEFRDRLERDFVSLENVIARETELVGTVKVKNVCFEKTVFVRRTTDDWVTSTDELCTFVDNGTNANITIIYDTFSFRFPLEGDKTQFCVCFRMQNGEEHWDNNGDRNYAVMRSDADKQQNSVVKQAMINGAPWHPPVRTNTWPPFPSANGYEASPYW